MTRIARPAIVVVAALLGLDAVAIGQDASTVRRAFEAGQFEQVIQAVGEDAPPAAIFTAAQSHQKLGALDRAREMYARLASRPETDAWRFVGLSASQLLDNDMEGAAGSARRAISIAGELLEGHYQHGLVLAKQQDWRAAAQAFDRATQLDPSHAYSYYYGGLMHYRANRPDLMAVRFEQFLRLAPDAPERPEVLQIMRTIRGK